MLMKQKVIVDDKLSLDIQRNLDDGWKIVNMSAVQQGYRDAICFYYIVKDDEPENKQEVLLKD